MLIFNTIANIFILAYIGYREYFYRFSFEWARTFWAKKIIGFSVFFWNKRRTMGKAIFRLNFINPNKAHEWDSAWYHKNKNT